MKGPFCLDETVGRGRDICKDVPLPWDVTQKQLDPYVGTELKQVPRQSAQSSLCGCDTRVAALVQGRGHETLRCAKSDSDEDEVLGRIQLGLVFVHHPSCLADPL
jgi:hypothetical protein